MSAGKLTLRTFLTATAVLAFMLPGRAYAADFERDFAAVVIRNCVGCHGADDPKGGLNLTTREGLLKGGRGGKVVVPGRPEESPLIGRVTEGTMPPKKQGRLAEADVSRLTAWVRDGAAWPDARVLSAFELSTDRRAGYDWWALQPIRRLPVPAVPAGEVLQNPIDAFVLARLREHGLSMAPAADPRTLIRRVTFDLIGLPPTPEEVAEFVKAFGAEPQAAYEELVDRLLASPHYGERWGRHWLDVTRFGESDGFENDRPRDHSWPYRDYVIRSFNADMPYPQFVREQIAGDALSPATRDAVAATGFLVAGPYDEIQNVAKSPTERKRAHEEQMEELLAAVGQTFLGLTVNCARCHDHKFDPIPQRDYYRLKAVFDGVDHGNRPLLTSDEQREYDLATGPLRKRIDELKASLAAAAGKAGEADPDAQPASALAEGKFGKALDARVASAGVPSKREFCKPPFTVECWGLARSKSAFNIFVANHLKESGDHWELYTYAGGGEFSVYLPGYEPAEIKSGVDVTDGKWHHLAMTFDGGEVNLFVDARRVKTTAVKRTKAVQKEGRLWFGAYPPQNIGCDGLVDEVRISSGVRAIERVPDGPFAADDKTLGLWHFDTPAPPKPDDPKAPADAAALQQELKQKEAELAARTPPLVYAGVRRQPEPTVVYLRGDVQKPGPTATPGALSALRSLPADLGLSADAPEAERRRKFADWMTHPDNPLPARVMVNRVWQYHFGQGLIDTPSDLGFNGGRPTHPELLDWLAIEFIDGGWSVKRLHRLIVTSAAYRQSSRFDAKAAAEDADDRLLWRFAPRRLEGEAVRDGMLAVSGELNPQMYGPSFRPFTVTVFNTYFYHLFDRGTPEFNRRTVYRMNVNTGRSPFLDALDCPAPSLAAPRRRTTTTPLQALALMNDTFVLRQAKTMAERVRAVAGDNTDSQVSLLFDIAFGRPPTAEERADFTKLLRDKDLETACWVLLNASEFVYVR